MSYQFEQHLDEESLESYAFGRLAESRVELLEEHLLICEQCRLRLDTTEQYINAMARGALRLQQKSAAHAWLSHVADWFNLASFRIPAPVWAAAAVAVFAILFFSTASLRRGQPDLSPVAVSLIAERSDSQIVPAHHALILHLDTRGLTMSPAVRVTLVDSVGRKVEEKTEPAAAFIEFQTTRALEPGAYFVRILKPDSSESAREFGLDVR